MSYRAPGGRRFFQSCHAILTFRLVLPPEACLGKPGKEKEKKKGAACLEVRSFSSHLDACLIAFDGAWPCISFPVSARWSMGSLQWSPLLWC